MHIRIEHRDIHHFRGGQGVTDVLRRVRIPIDDVDLLAAELLHDVGHARSSRPDARALGVDTLDGCTHRNLGAVACLARDADNLYRTVGYLRHLECEQASNQLGVRARQVDLHALVALVHTHHVSLDAIAVAQHFARDLLCRQQDAVLRVCLRTELDDADAARLCVGIALDQPRDNLALEFGVLAVNAASLRLAQTALDRVTHGDGTNSGEVHRRVVVFRDDFAFGVELADDNGNVARFGVNVHTRLGTLRTAFLLELAV